VTRAPAELFPELKAKPPRVEAAATAVHVRAIHVRCPPAGRRPLAFFVQSWPPAFSHEAMVNDRHWRICPGWS
jgi:hypothetical protein